MTSEPDEVMVRIADAVAKGQAGEREAARSALAGLWDEIGPDGDPFHRCALSHHLADVQDDPHEELAWDLRALDAADGLTDERVAEAGVAGSVLAFYPSLHLNLADVYRRLGDREQALEHVRLGHAVVGALGDDGYGAMVRGGLRRIADELADGAPVVGGAGASPGG